MFNKLKNLLGATKTVLKNEDIDKPIKKRKPSKTELQKHLDMLARQKAIADAKNEPWVAIVDMDVDYNNLNDGAFELDWNDRFIAQLMRAGYVGKEDADLVDQWFTNICRNVVLETFEQAQADPQNRVDLGNGLREYK
jgi:hypothetical protein